MDRAKKYIPYLTLAGIAVFFCWLFVGRHGIFGARVDWFSQHSVLPEYFRQQFYATGNLFPEFAANIGGGQNIYHFAYYGLYSPLILPSYLLPFVKMSDYIMGISILGLLASVLLFYHWMRKRGFETDISYVTALLFLLAGPMIGQYSGQIMFVDYMPFLCLAFLGVDRYFDEGRSGLYTISVFLMIMTSFYFSIGGMLVLVLYGMYRYFQKKEGCKVTVYCFLADGIRYVCPMLLAVAMSAFFLVPTALALTGNRSKGQNISLATLFVPEIEIERFVYSIYGIGLTTLVITVLIAGLFYKKRYEKVLVYGCVIVLVVPVFAYLLNGGLYIRDKVFIPFLPLLCYMIALYLAKCRTREISRMIGSIPYIATMILVYIERNQFTKGGMWEILLVESALFFFCFLIGYGKKDCERNRKVVYWIAVPSILCLIITMNTFYQYKSGRYVSHKMYAKVTKESNCDQVKKILAKDKGYYRIEQIGNEDKNAADLNRIWDKNQNITSIYSSAYNTEYQRFRKKTFGVEEPFRNDMMQSVSKNPVFQRVMGVRYVLSDKDADKDSDKGMDKGVYKNENAAPVAYATDRVISEKEYRTCSYPYNQTALLDVAVTDEETGNKKENLLTTYDPVTLKMDGTYGKKIRETATGYKVRLKKNKRTGFVIQKTDVGSEQDQTLFLRFSIRNQHPDKDVTVWVNGIRNKLTAKDHLYYNANKTFTYAVPLEAGSDRITVKFGKGRYQLTHIEAYAGKLPERSEDLYQSELTIDRKQTKDNRIQGTIHVKKDGWFITSIPYDSHFQIFVDGKETKLRKVNTAFAGCELKKGRHEIRLIYHAPGAKAGKVISLAGILGVILLLGAEKRRRTGRTTFAIWKK